MSLGGPLGRGPVIARATGGNHKGAAALCFRKMRNGGGAWIPRVAGSGRLRRAGAASLGDTGLVSSENVAIVRALAEGFQRRDHERAFDFYDADIEWDVSRVGDTMLELAGVYHGHEGVRTYWRQWLSAWSDLEFEIQDVLDAGDEGVLLVRNQRQWGRHSGIVTEFPPFAQVFTFRDGRIVRMRAYPDQRLALRAVGLEE